MKFTKMIKQKCNQNNDRGAIVVEATIALTAFIFAIFTILSLVHMCYVQAKVGTALSSATKEVSQYSYLYYKFSLDKSQAEMHDNNEQSRQTVDKTVEGIGSIFSGISDGQASLESGSFSGLQEAAESVETDATALFKMYKTELSDPKKFMTGMLKLAGEEILEEGKDVLGMLMARAFMQKNLADYDGADADAFLRHYRVKNGIDGMSFWGSSLMAYGKSDTVQMVVEYEIEIIRLFNFDLTCTIQQVAKSEAWGNGVSLIEKKQIKEVVDKRGEGVWDLQSPTERGKIISDLEKENYKYTSSSNGFDAYNKNNNEFIVITSMHGNSYSVKSNVKNKIQKVFNDTYKKTERLEGSIKVKDTSTGKDVTLSSDKNSRAIRVVLVVPENADLNMIKQVAKDFEKEQKANGKNVTVEVKPGYGKPAEK